MKEAYGCAVSASRC